MRYFASLILSLCVLGAGHVAYAQTQDPWVEFSSPADYFHVSMPHQPKEETLSKLESNFGDLDIHVKSYQASLSGATYRLWVFTLPERPNEPAVDTDGYLDSGAEVIWEGLLKPERDKLPDDRRATAGMAYVKELAAKPLPGREYTLTIGRATGTAQLYVTKSRVYVLLAMNSIGATWQQEPFFQSFVVAPDVPEKFPSAATSENGMALSSPNDITGEEKIFRTSEVSSRARVISKPEPSYTESARKFSITGTVVVRAIFSRNGEVTNLRIIRKLPHGLTQQAANAARAIRFTPAVKDGQSVSMWIQLEYNFNLY